MRVLLTESMIYIRSTHLDNCVLYSCIQLVWIWTRNTILEDLSACNNHELKVGYKKIQGIPYLSNIFVCTKITYFAKFQTKTRNQSQLYEGKELRQNLNPYLNLQHNVPTYKNLVYMTSLQEMSLILFFIVSQKEMFLDFQLIAQYF